MRPGSASTMDAGVAVEVDLLPRAGPQPPRNAGTRAFGTSQDSRTAAGDFTEVTMPANLGRCSYGRVSG